MGGPAAAAAGSIAACGRSSRSCGRRSTTPRGNHADDAQTVLDGPPKIRRTVCVLSHFARARYSVFNLYTSSHVPEFKSQIRDSDKQTLLERVRRLSLKYYLRSLKLSRVRGFIEESVSFDFPVTALIGPNGGGKTTILGAAACLYEDVAPRLFFAKTGILDEEMADWRISYTAVDKTGNEKGLVARTCSFRRARWDRDALSRPVAIFGVSRTVPANERNELRKCTMGGWAPPSDVGRLSAAAAKAVERVLGRTASGYSHYKLDQKKTILLFSGRTDDGVGYSEFHFGAGESSIVRMIMSIELMPDGALVLIEEVENGLHPIATVRMVEYFLEVSIRKKVQIIFTTHSNEALAPLPPEAIWAAVGRRVFQGKLDIRSLRAINHVLESKAVIFVEDVFAQKWVETCLRMRTGIACDAIEVHPLGGDGTAKSVHLHRRRDPSLAGTPSVCILDGDSKQQDDALYRVLRLPGESPELFIYGRVERIVESEAGRLAIALHQHYETQSKVVAAIRDVLHANHDPHLLFSQLGQRLNFVAEDTVRGAFLTVWATYYPDEVARILEPIMDILPKIDGSCRPDVDDAEKAQRDKASLQKGQNQRDTEGSDAPDKKTQVTKENSNAEEQLSLLK